MNLLSLRLFLMMYVSDWWISVSADDFSVPTQWRSKTFADMQDKRISVSRQAISHIMQNITETQDGITNMDPWQIAGIVSSIALADLASGAVAHQQMVATLLSKRATDLGFFDSTYVDPAIDWGMACLYAYRAYQQTDLLDLAQRVWQGVDAFFVTEDQAASGHHPQRYTNISSKCQGFSTAGGVFSFVDKSDTSVQPVTVAQFAAFSALLGEQTKKDMYTKAAVLSAQFVRNLLTDSSGLIYGGIRLQDCFNTSKFEEANSGYAIQAWSVLADISADDHWRIDALQTLKASTTTPRWTSPNGIILLRDDARVNNDNDGSGKGIFVSRLYEAWRRNRNDLTLSKYIEAYVATQYHALRELATVDGSDYYNADFVGPKIGYWTRVGVMASTPVLAIAAAPFDSIESTSSTSSAGAKTSTSTNAENSNAGAKLSHTPLLAPIIGGVIGGLLLLGVIVLVLLRCRRLRTNVPVQSKDHEDILTSDLDHPSLPAPSQPTSREKVRHELAGAMNNQPSTPGPISSRSTPDIPMDQLVELVYQRLQVEHAHSAHYGDALPSSVSDAVEVAYQRLQAERPTYNQAETRRPLPVPTSPEPDLPPYVR